MTRDGAVILVVKLPDGRSERVPLSWTEIAPDGPTIPVLLFSPSSLRALVRLVREHGIPPSAETDHGGRGIPDLEAPARSIAPVIDEALALLRDTAGTRLERMSGSGATCFALYETEADRSTAAASIRRARPGWWCLESTLA